ncbi:MAG: type I DNA topoisomerase [Gemmatimonadales bacterium]|nr:MAG: type I DNA topoisomerase [Gemmatimonadales bacterium]
MAKGNGSKGRQLVIVESPAKARTIGRYLGRRFDVAASVGHVRDLPKKDLGVDVEGDFEPKYVTIRGKGKVLKELKDKARKADSIILATDPDREGEAIAYHVAEQLGWEKEPERFRRVEFREITKRAVERALEDPGHLDLKKVEAQQARRILDRLVGYQVSPFLWKPIRPGLSAGRVQTVALRLICEREDEIRRFEAEEYWSITAHLQKDEDAFEAKLQKINGKSFTLPDETTTQAVLDAVDGVPFRTTSVKRRERRKNAPAPFTTSTLQQEAAKRLRYSARRTMSNAQRLYEGREVGSRGTVGLITYMRTDSTRVSAEAAAGAQSWVRGKFGDRYTPSSPRLWGGKQAKGAQEAHEAIRPTDPGLHPDEARRYLDDDEARLYELIWLRFVASQMSPTVYDTTTLDFDLEGADGRSFTFRATGSVVKFDGFTRVYREATETGDHRRLDDLEPLPSLEEGEVVDRKSMEPKQHFTQPPPRFSEASLVKELEKLGIGRPSTYAQIISTILDRGYVEMEERRFIPTALGDTVSKLLVRVFPNIFDVAFTSRMEGELDRVEEGEVGWRELLKEFYPPFQDRLEKGKAESDEIVKELLAAEGETCEKCNSPMVVKWNRFGRFLGCSAYPECKSTRSLDGPGDLEEDQELGRHPESGKPVWLKAGPYGPYVQLGEKEEGSKPPRASLPSDVKPEDADLDLALKLLSLPRELGTDPGTGEPVKAGLGRYGPYVNRAREYRNLAGFQQIFEVTLDEALELLKQKQGPAVLKEVGKHPETGRELQILDGRYGPYLTDGELNASLGKGEDPADMDLDAAVELLERSGKRPRGRRGSSSRKKGSTAKAKGGATKKGTTKKKGATKKGGSGG